MTKRHFPIDNPFLVFGAPQIEQAEIDEVVDSLKTGWLGTGPKVARFEEEFASYKGVTPRHAAAVNSCTAALHVSIIAADLQPGDEVITTPMTFCATVNAIIHSSLTPVLADIETDTFNIDPCEIESKITPRTRAIVLVHFSGRPCNMTVILDIAEKYNLVLIEDCAHAIETQWHGKHAGTIGDFGCFSFYSTKNVVTGEGGMVIAKDRNKIDKVKLLALHGMDKDAWHRFSDTGYKHYQVVDYGFKYNMMDIQAAIGIHQLARVERNWKVRQSIWNHYQESLADLPIELPLAPDPDTRHAYHLYPILIDEDSAGLSRNQFLDEMTKLGIGVGVHYLSIPEHEYYQRRFGWNPNDYPVAQKIGKQTVSIPLSAKLTIEDAERVVSSVRKVLHRQV